MTVTSVLCDYSANSGDVSALAGDVSSPGSGQSESTCSSPNTGTHDTGTKMSTFYVYGILFFGMFSLLIHDESLFNSIHRLLSELT